jgi:hypothetical protein
MEVRTIRKMVIKRRARDAKANPGVAVIALAARRTRVPMFVCADNDGTHVVPDDSGGCP